MKGKPVSTKSTTSLVADAVNAAIQAARTEHGVEKTWKTVAEAHPLGNHGVVLIKAETQGIQDLVNMIRAGFFAQMAVYALMAFNLGSFLGGDYVIAIAAQGLTVEAFVLDSKAVPAFDPTTGWPVCVAHFGNHGWLNTISQELQGMVPPPAASF